MFSRKTPLKVELVKVRIAGNHRVRNPHRMTEKSILYFSRYHPLDLVPEMPACVLDIGQGSVIGSEVGDG